MGVGGRAQICEVLCSPDNKLDFSLENEKCYTSQQIKESTTTEQEAFTIKKAFWRTWNNVTFHYWERVDQDHKPGLGKK